MLRLLSCCTFPGCFVHSNALLFPFACLLQVMEDFVEGPFSVLYVHSALSKANAPSSQFLARVYRLLPRQYKKNCKAL